jgi:hypothetical protein
MAIIPYEKSFVIVAETGKIETKEFEDLQYTKTTIKITTDNIVVVTIQKYNSTTSSWEEYTAPFEVETTNTTTITDVDTKIRIIIQNFGFVDANVDLNVEIDEYNLYTTPTIVARDLQDRDPENPSQIRLFTSTTIPSEDDVIRYILANMKKIDNKTKRNWREIKNVADGQYEYLDKQYPRQLATSDYNSLKWELNLKYRNIKSITLFEQGRNYAEYKNILTDYEEGRNKDYWVDYRQGIIYLLKIPVWTENNSFRINYTYGEELPEDIQKACKLMTINDILKNDKCSKYSVQGADNILQIDPRIRSNEREIADILSNYIELFGKPL